MDVCHQTWLKVEKKCAMWTESTELIDQKGSLRKQYKHTMSLMYQLASCPNKNIHKHYMFLWLIWWHNSNLHCLVPKLVHARSMRSCPGEYHWYQIAYAISVYNGWSCTANVRHHQFYDPLQNMKITNKESHCIKSDIPWQSPAVANYSLWWF